MKIYFCGSIRAGRADVETYAQIVEFLKKFGQVLTEHVADRRVTHMGEDAKDDCSAHDRDIEMLLASDVVVAEVTTPSLGVGYELGRAVEQDKRILCLYRPQAGKRLSAMVGGCSEMSVVEYRTIDEAKLIITEFLRER